jgi:two-component system sporulation sensor kinase B
MKEILLNILFILVVIFFIQLLFEDRRKELSEKQRGFFIYVASAITMLFCLTYAIPVGEQLQYDISAVPIILGSLFGGPLVSVALFLIVLIYYFFIDFVIGFLGASLNYGILTLVLCLLYTRFNRTFFSHKLLLETGITMFHVLLSEAIIIFFFSFFYYRPLSLNSPLSCWPYTLLNALSKTATCTKKLKLKKLN